MAENINQTLDSRRTAREIEQAASAQMTQMLALSTSIWQPMLQAQTVWLRTFADGFEAMAENLEKNIRGPRAA